MKVIAISAKCNDRCVVGFPDGTNHFGYVPRGIGIGDGDYLSLNVDLDTGRIIDWDREAVLELQEKSKPDYEKR